MKKIVSIFSAIFVMLLFSVNIFAADSSTDNKTSTKITVAFTAGNGVYIVNEKVVKAEASTTVNGKVFVPVKVITDALNADLTVDLKKKTAVINYNGVEIKLTEKKLEATVAGKSVKADAAPYIKNSSFMASISFLADTFGADMTNKSGQVSFIKEIANPNSIKDFGTLIKKTTKDKIGDSYYNWSMLLPDDLELEYRNFSGTDNYFIAQDGSYEVALYLYDADENSNLDNVENFMFEWTKNYTLIDYKRDSINGLDFVEFIYKDNNWTYRKRVFITKEREYQFIIYTLNDDDYSSEKYQNIIDSLTFKFPKDKSSEDLSDVKADGYRTYQDTRLKWSMNIIPYWREVKDDNIQNNIVFYGEGSELASVSVFSLEKGETLDSVTQQKIKDRTDAMNPELFKITNQESTTVNGISCNKIYYSVSLYDQAYTGCDVIIVDKNYKYILNSMIPAKEYTKSSKRNMLQGMLNSFKFAELDTKTVGKLLDRNKVILSNNTRNIDQTMYSVKLPFNWIEDDENTNDTQYYYKGSLGLSVSVFKELRLGDVVRFYDDKFKKSASEDLKLVSRTTITEKGTTCYKYVVVFKENNSEFASTIYVFQKGNNVFYVSLLCENIYYGPTNTDILNKIWESFTAK